VASTCLAVLASGDPIKDARDDLPPGVYPAKHPAPSLAHDPSVVEPDAPTMPSKDEETPVVEPSPPTMPSEDDELPAVESTTPAMPSKDDGKIPAPRGVSLLKEDQVKEDQQLEDVAKELQAQVEAMQEEENERAEAVKANAEPAKEIREAPPPSARKSRRVKRRKEISSQQKRNQRNAQRNFGHGSKYRMPSLEEIFFTRISTLKHVPRRARVASRDAYKYVLRQLADATTDKAATDALHRLFLFTKCIFAASPAHRPGVARPNQSLTALVKQRVEDWQEGHFGYLWREACKNAIYPTSQQVSEREQKASNVRRAIQLAKEGAYSCRVLSQSNFSWRIWSIFNSYA